MEFPGPAKLNGSDRIRLRNTVYFHLSGGTGTRTRTGTFQNKKVEF